MPWRSYFSQTFFTEEKLRQRSEIKAEEAELAQVCWALGDQDIFILS